MNNPNPHFINGSWSPSQGDVFSSINPATEVRIWEGNEANEQTVNQAVISASNAFNSWKELPLAARIEYLQAFGKALSVQRDILAKAISEENGKPLWESLTEVAAMIAKIDISIEAQATRCPEISRLVPPQGNLIVRHRPHGVLVVLGPFNFPGHLPNGHIIPALLAGNTLVYKPSELTPRVGELIAKCWEKAKLPPGVFNLIQGGISTGKLLTHHPDIQGILFTGSWKTGVVLSEIMGNRPDRILALEMGGNNPLVVGSVENLAAAAYTIVQSAFITSGQRCTCARRLIVPKGDKGDSLILAVLEMTKSLRIGPYTESPEPFMGPLISKQAAEKVYQAYQQLIHSGGTPLLPMQQLNKGSAFLSPGIVDMTLVTKRIDEEIFGPVLQLYRPESFEAAVTEANNTAYGLSSGLLSDNQAQFNYFYANIHAGVINWNTPLTGASSHVPFGGIGKSGNHRPSAYWAADYCSYPIASLEALKLTLPQQKLPGIGFIPPNDPESCCG